MKEADMQTVVDLIDRILVNTDDEQTLLSVKGDVGAFMKQFPLYPELG
jgi:glycine hydroxymethyltransferase